MKLMTSFLMKISNKIAAKFMGWKGLRYGCLALNFRRDSAHATSELLINHKMMQPTQIMMRIALSIEDTIDAVSATITLKSSNSVLYSKIMLIAIEMR